MKDVFDLYCTNVESGRSSLMGFLYADTTGGFITDFQDLSIFLFKTFVCVLETAKENIERSMS